MPKKSKLILITQIALTIGLFFTNNLPVKAATSQTATGAAIASSSAETQALLENLERIARDKNQNDQIKSIYDDLNAKKKGYIAQVISLKEKTVKVKSPDGTEQFLTFDKSTSLIKKGKETTADQIEISEWINIDDWLVLIGVEEEDQFLPRRVLISSISLAPKEKIVKIGSINQINKTKMTFTAKGSDDSAAEYKIDKNTIFTDKSGEIIKITQIKPDMQALITGTIGTTNTTPTITTIKVLSPLGE